MNVPNLISLIRLLAVPFMIYLILNGFYFSAFWLFVAAGISDGIDGFIVSWWGITSLEDYALDSIMKIAHKMNFQITVYFEKVRFRKVETTTRDLLHLIRRYQHNPSWLKVDNRPVFFIYTSNTVKCWVFYWMQYYSCARFKFYAFF